tara:strand:+ start:831 stop:1103 length:273 start_codon:yes stop_codon:yes gene_type:complete
MNASETLLREILREMQKQTEILERIDRNLPQMAILIHQRPNGGRAFDRISINCGKRSRNRSRNSGLRASPQKILNPEEVSASPEKHHPIQ